jgi:hypothetical protein
MSQQALRNKQKEEIKILYEKISSLSSKEHQDLANLCSIVDNDEILTGLLDEYAHIIDSSMCLQFACYNGSSKCIKMLIKRGADPHVQSDYCFRVLTSYHSYLLKELHLKP